MFAEMPLDNHTVVNSRLSPPFGSLNPI